MTIKNITDRIQRYFESKASAETDTQTTREALQTFISLQLSFRDYCNDILLNEGVNGPLSYLRYRSDEQLPNPKLYTSYEMIVKTTSYKGKSLFIVVASRDDPESLTDGIFARKGLYGEYTIFLYLPRGFSLESINDVRKFVMSNKQLRTTFVHEFGHLDDLIDAKTKNPSADPFRSYINYVDPHSTKPQNRFETTNFVNTLIKLLK